MNVIDTALFVTLHVCDKTVCCYNALIITTHVCVQTGRNRHREDTDKTHTDRHIQAETDTDRHIQAVSRRLSLQPLAATACQPPLSPTAAAPGPPWPQRRGITARNRSAATSRSSRSIVAAWPSTTEDNKSTRSRNCKTWRPAAGRRLALPPAAAAAAA